MKPNHCLFFIIISSVTHESLSIGAEIDADSALQYMAQRCSTTNHLISTTPSDEAVALAIKGINPDSVETFVHIPRMGGTAWSWHLRATYKGKVAPGSRDAAIFSSTTKSRERDRNARVLFGHNRFPDLPRGLGITSPVHGTTILRDPRVHALASGCRDPECGDTFVNGPRRDAIALAFYDACQRCHSELEKGNVTAYGQACASVEDACVSMGGWAGPNFNGGVARINPIRFAARTSRRAAKTWLYWFEGNTNTPSACESLAATQQV